MLEKGLVNDPHHFKGSPWALFPSLECSLSRSSAETRERETEMHRSCTACRSQTSWSVWTGMSILLGRSFQAPGSHWRPTLQSHCLLAIMWIPSWSFKKLFVFLFSINKSLCGDTAQEVRAVVWQSEGCRFEPTLGVSKCPWARRLTPDCSWRAGWYFPWQPIAVGVWIGEWEA